MLAYPDINDGEFIMDCDASNIAIRAVLSQMMNGTKKVISYKIAHYNLSKTEQKYCVSRKEMLAVVVFTGYFKHYLLAKTLCSQNGLRSS